MKIWTLFKHENLATGNKILWKRGEIAPKEQYFQYISNTRSQITYIFVNCGIDLFFLNSANLICRGTDISKYFRVSLEFEITRVDCIYLCMYVCMYADYRIYSKYSDTFTHCPVDKCLLLDEYSNRVDPNQTPRLHWRYTVCSDLPVRLPYPKFSTFKFLSTLILRGVSRSDSIFVKLLFEFGKTGLSKQCRPRSVATERGVRSGSTLFAESQNQWSTLIGTFAVRIWHKGLFTVLRIKKTMICRLE